MRPVDKLGRGDDDEDQAMLQVDEKDGGEGVDGPGGKGQAEAQQAIANPISKGVEAGVGDGGDDLMEVHDARDPGEGGHAVVVRGVRGVGEEEGRRLWEQCDEVTRGVAGHLTEALRLVLLPTQRAKLQVKAYSKPSSPPCGGISQRRPHAPSPPSPEAVVRGGGLS